MMNNLIGQIMLINFFHRRSRYLIIKMKIKSDELNSSILQDFCFVFYYSLWCFLLLNYLILFVYIIYIYYDAP